MIPRATLRLQFHAGFTLDDACAHVDHFAALGVSHVYASPLWTARPGSTHGYDIVDPTAVNPELGGEPALRRFVAALRARGLGLVLDIVPNHMGVGCCENPWWQDVLERGPASAYAHWFDIDWHPSDPALQGRLLAPFLGRPYGEALEAGELALGCDRERGALYCGYYAQRFPLAPACYAEVLGEADGTAAGDDGEGGGARVGATEGEGGSQGARATGAAAHAGAVGAGTEAAAVEAGAAHAAATDPAAARDPAWAAALDAFRRAVGPDGTLDAPAFDAARAALARALATPAGARALDAVLARHDPASAAGRERLHALLDRQHYRLAYWRTAADEINWRRFFEVNDLAGLRMERDEVFEAVHALTFRLYAEGLIDGLRIDHVDGLEDPGGYCRRLRRRLEELAPQRPPPLDGDRAWIVVEKILAGGEALPADWAVDGSTGYDFMDQAGALLHDPAGAEPLAALWREQAGGAADFESEVQAAKRDVLNENLAAELAATARAFHAVALEDLATRDMTLQAISRALTEFLVHLPVYRLYRRPSGRSVEDVALVEGTLAAARATLRSPDEAVLEQLGRWLLADAGASDALRRAIVRFEHLTPPLAAKAIEDTAFYRYGRLLSRNEVGSAGSAFALGAEDFHRLAERRAAEVPHALLALSTHDHKRGADLRARLAVLSERPEQWAQTVARWRALNEPHRRAEAAVQGQSSAEPPPTAETMEATQAGGGPAVEPVEAPDPADELMLYQMLVGAWPPGLAPDDREGLERLAARLAAWQEKSLREAQRRSSWARPDAAYEAGCARFLRRILGLDAEGAGQEAPFLHALAGFVETAAPAGALNGLVQAALQLTVPGVPDLYQGAERWDYSLVDPDNRTAIDFAERAAAAAADLRPLPERLAAWPDGAVKQALVVRLLGLRARREALFRDGGYRPLALHGALRAHALAFAREAGDERVLVVVTLHASHRLQPGDAPRIPPARWEDTRLALPQGWEGDWVDALTGRHRVGGPELALAELLGDLPVAVLEPSPSA
jgi:(1->4)-alpha-D-glucan 1-alpha-D-glucosylmutase